MQVNQTTAVQVKDDVHAIGRALQWSVQCAREPTTTPESSTTTTTVATQPWHQKLLFANARTMHMLFELDAANSNHRIADFCSVAANVHHSAVLHIDPASETCPRDQVLTFLLGREVAPMLVVDWPDAFGSETETYDERVKRASMVMSVAFMCEAWKTAVENVTPAPVRVVLILRGALAAIPLLELCPVQFMHDQEATLFHRIGEGVGGLGGPWKPWTFASLCAETNILDLCAERQVRMEQHKQRMATFPKTGCVTNRS